MQWNTYNCMNCTHKYKHPTVIEEKRVRLHNNASTEIDEFNNNHETKYCRCKKDIDEEDGGNMDNCVLSCASCMKQRTSMGAPRMRKL